MSNSSGTGERDRGDRLGGGGGGERGSNAGLSSSTGVNHHHAGSGQGSLAGGGSSSGSLATGGNPPGSLPPGAASGQPPSGQARNLSPLIKEPLFIFIFFFLLHVQASSTGMTSANGPAVLQLQFLINEGALVSATSDDVLHLWNIRQKRPEIVHSLKFQRERYPIPCLI